MAALPYMKLYPNDYFGDTGHLSCLQHGIYLQLILRYFIRGGPLPDDDRFLANTVGLGCREWARHRDTISEFFEITGGEWFHRRIDRELADATAKVLKSKKAAQASVKHRFNGRSTDVQRTLTYTEPESESPCSIDIEQECARDARDDSDDRRKKGKPARARFKFDGEGPEMEAVRRELAEIIGDASYALGFCDPKRPVELIVEDERLLAVCSTAFAHSMIRDHEYQLSKIAKQHGFKEAWIRERTPT